MTHPAHLAPCPRCGQATRELIGLTPSTGVPVVACPACVARAAEAASDWRTHGRVLAAW